MALGIFVRGSLRNLNYIKFKKRKLKYQHHKKKKKKNSQMYEILQFLSTNKERKKMIDKKYNGI